MRLAHPASVRSLRSNAVNPTASKMPPISVKFIRGAPPRLKWRILQTLLTEKLNPLSCFHLDRFVIAVTDTDEKLAGFGQIKPLTDTANELSSLVVLPEFRRRGVGTALVDQLLENADPQKKIFLITTSRRAPFYAKAGFTLFDSTDPSIPLLLILEKTIGTPIARMAAQDELVVMGRKQ